MTVPAQAARAHRAAPPPHGDDRRAVYWGCRCEACREAYRLREKRYRLGTAPSRYAEPTGTMRRIQALVADGHTYARLERETGKSHNWFAQLATGRDVGPRGVMVRTATEITELYQRLTEEDPPTGRPATYARTVARRYGWHPPEAWSDASIEDPAARPYDWLAGEPVWDEVEVQRVMKGGHQWGRVDRPTRVEAVRRLLAEGLGPTAIGDRFGAHPSTVQSFIVKHLRAGEAAA